MIGGSTAGAAGLGGIFGGKKGALIGAAIGGGDRVKDAAGALVFDTEGRAEEWPDRLAGDGRERSRALGAAGRMLADTQQRLPGGIDDALRSALRSHEGGDHHGADRSLREALKLAQQRGLV